MVVGGGELQNRRKPPAAQSRYCTPTCSLASPPGVLIDVSESCEINNNLSVQHRRLRNEQHGAVQPRAKVCTPDVCRQSIQTMQPRPALHGPIPTYIYARSPREYTRPKILMCLISPSSPPIPLPPAVRIGILLVLYLQVFSF